MRLRFFTGVLLAILLPMAAATTAQSAYFVDNSASGCSNGSTSYNPSNRTCSGGSDTVYTSLNNANSAVSAGTSGNPKVINIRQGTYTGTVDITKNYTIWRRYSGDSMPVLDGAWTSPGQYDALIGVSNTTGVTIDGLYFMRAGYQQSGSTKYSQSHAIQGNYVNSLTVQNCEFYNIGDASILLMYTGSGHVIQDNYIHYSGHSGYSGEPNNWTPTIALRLGTTNSIVRRNIIDGIWNEGISTDEDCSGNIIEYNVIRNCVRITLYFASSTSETIRYNLVYNTNSDPEFENGTFSGLGLVISSENSGYTNGTGFLVYGNMFSGMAVGILIDRTSTSPSWQLNNSKFYNNTFVEQIRAPDQWGTLAAGWEVRTATGDPIGSGVEFKNNLVFQTTGYTGNDPGTGVSYANNVWSKAPTAACRASSDPGYSAYSTLSVADYLQKTSGWLPLGNILLTGHEFAIRETALQVIDAGATLSGYDMLLDLLQSDFTTKTFAIIDQDGYGSAWDIGAGPYTGGSQPPDDWTPTGAISRASWACTADSEETTAFNGVCENSFDANSHTSWHTAWSGGSPDYPHQVEYALGSAQNISALRYVRCGSECANGTVDAFTVYTSTNGTDWTQRDSSGTISWGTERYHDLVFASTYEGVTHVRFIATSEINDNPWASMAEFYLVGAAGGGGGSDLLEDATALWTFSGGAGTATVGTNWTLNGTTAGAADHDAVATEAIGVTGSSSNSLSIIDGTAPEFGSSAFSIVFWAYGSGSSGWHPFLSKWTEGQKSWAIGWNGDDSKINFWGTDGGSDWPPDVWIEYAPGSWSNAWHHIAVTRNGTNWLLYVDGVLRSNDNGTSCTLYNGTEPMRGFRDGDGYYFTGRLDDMAIFDRAINSDEVAALYAMGTNFDEDEPPPPPGIALEISNLTRTKIHVTAGVPVTVIWDYVGDVPPTTCTLNGTSVTCGDKQATLIFEADELGWHDVEFEITNGVENDSATLEDVIFVGSHEPSVKTYTIGPTAGQYDFTGTVSYDAVLGPPDLSTFILTGNANPNMSALPSGFHVSIKGSGYGTLTGRAGLVIWTGDWAPSSFPTMGNNVELGERVLPLMNWSGTGGGVPDNAVFFGQGEGLLFDLSGLDIPEGEHCYVQPLIPHGAFTLDPSSDAGDCSLACEDRMICIHPDYLFETYMPPTLLMF